jgi:diguanylate cyclase (GGDEF)-like protein
MHAYEDASWERPGSLLTTGDLTIYDVARLSVVAQIGDPSELQAHARSRIAASASKPGGRDAQWWRTILIAGQLWSDSRKAVETSTEIADLARRENEASWRCLGLASRSAAYSDLQDLRAGYEDLVQGLVLLDEMLPSEGPLSVPADELERYLFAVAGIAVFLACAAHRFDDVSDDVLTRVEEFSSNLSVPYLQLRLAMNRGWLDLQRALDADLIGDVATARRCYRQSSETHRLAERLARAEGVGDWEREASMTWASTQALADPRRLAEPEFAHIVALIDPSIRYSEALGHLALARVDAHRGEFPSANTHLDRALEHSDPAPAFGSLIGCILAERAELASLESGLPLHGEHTRLVRRLLEARRQDRQMQEKYFLERVATERTQHAQKEAERVWMTDPLTGLGNRRLVDVRLGEALVNAQSAREGFAVAFMDVDNFKQVNDHFSHLVGDQVLREVGQIIAGAISPKDVAARFGGDEFVLILVGHSDSQAVALAETIRQRVAAHQWTIPDVRKAIHVTVGVAHALPDTSALDVLRAADEAMLEGKRAGKNRVRARGKSNSNFDHAEGPRHLRWREP